LIIKIIAKLRHHGLHFVDNQASSLQKGETRHIHWKWNVIYSWTDCFQFTSKLLIDFFFTFQNDQ